MDRGEREKEKHEARTHMQVVVVVAIVVVTRGRFEAIMKHEEEVVGIII